MKLDVVGNRTARKWSYREQMARVLWALIWPLFRLSPRPFWGWAWRRGILRIFGAKVGRNAHIAPGVKILIPWNLHLGEDCTIGDRAILYALGPITIGDRATVSQGAHICAGTHDVDDPVRPLLKLPICIGEDAWVCADAFIGPGVTVGRGAVVGARAVVVRDIGHNCIVAGNPAKFIRKVGE